MEGEDFGFNGALVLSINFGYLRHNEEQNMLEGGVSL